MQIDPYEGWSDSRLKERCHDLCRAYSHQQQMILVMSEVPGAIESLHPDDQKKVKQLRAAFWPTPVDGFDIAEAKAALEEAERLGTTPLDELKRRLGA